jgi:eukaryotic-like serine/threonine-protein kinase
MSRSEFLTMAVRGSGTFLYASPEQSRGNDSVPRDDVLALGVIWYQMLIGDLTKGRPGGTDRRDRRCRSTQRSVGANPGRRELG